MSMCCRVIRMSVGWSRGGASLKYRPSRARIVSVLPAGLRCIIRIRSAPVGSGHDIPRGAAFDASPGSQPRKYPSGLMAE